MSEFQVIAQTHESYPSLLKNIPDLPALLYVKGSLPSQNEKLFAVVGARKPTAYGREAAMFLTRELCRAGFSIVSGLALGVDGIAHETALQEGAKTYAVLGCGADIVYPIEHQSLYKRVVERGSVISEYDPGTPPMPFRFPARNRIIAGMCLGTLVVEAREKSGALITGNLALDYNREVFAVPGQIFSQYSKGPHTLIKRGAKLVEHINDILHEFGWEAQSIQQKIFENVSAEEKLILEAIRDAAQHADTLVRETHLSAAQVHSLLTMLEIKGAIKSLGGNMYSLKR